MSLLCPSSRSRARGGAISTQDSLDTESNYPSTAAQYLYRSEFIVCVCVPLSSSSSSFSCVCAGTGNNTIGALKARRYRMACVLCKTIRNDDDDSSSKSYDSPSCSCPSPSSSSMLCHDMI